LDVSDPTAEAPAAPVSLSDVVVTAQKREEKVQDVPASITVASGQQLVQQNVTTANDVERLTPNLSGQQSSGRQSRARWFLRGVGTNDPSLNLESPIGFYQDEVFIAYSLSQTFPLFDLERVEVLKGPQGTLWGKNTTGGALHFISKKPGFDYSGYTKGTFGSYGLVGAEGGFGGPVLGTRLAARGAFFYEKLDGWATNLRDGSKAPQYTDFAARLQLLANVTDDFEVLLQGRYRLLAGGTNAAYPVGVLPDGSIQQNPASPAAWTPSYGKNPKIKDDFYGGQSSNQLQTTGALATLNYHLDDYMLTSISAIDYTTDITRGFGYQPVVSFNQTGTDNNLESRQISQEFRITSPRADRFNWIAGFHYFNWNLYADNRSGNFGPNPARRSFNQNIFRQNDISYAGFASAKFDFTDDLALTVGGRYTHDQKYVDAQRISGTGEGITFLDPGNWSLVDRVATVEPLSSTVLSPQKGWGQFTYDITPEYKINEDVLAYVRFARGFRAGVFNPTILPPSSFEGAVLPTANPEVLHDLELGVKSSWFDDHLIANLSLFHYWIDHVQLNVQQPNPLGLPNVQGSTVQDAASGVVRGAELELEALLTQDLRLRGGLGLVDSEYLDFTTYQGTEVVDASGNVFYRVPKVSATLGGSYTLPVTADTAFGVGTDWIVRSKIFHNAVIQDDPVQQTPAYAIGNADVRYVLEKGRFTIQAYVKNLTDVSYAVFSSVPNGGSQTNNLGAPRTYGLQFIAQL
jgi:iron complex outermembrane recepter protein